MTIICYTGGTCGDILTAIVDPTAVNINNNVVRLSEDRTKLKKPHLFNNDLEKDQYIKEISILYKSIPSHDLDYHIRKHHNFISISVSDFSVAMWAAERFKKLHRPHVWEEMQKFCGANSIEDYAQMLIDFSNMVQGYTDKIIKLERILTGFAIDDLESLTNIKYNSEIYQSWLNIQNYIRK